MIFLKVAVQFSALIGICLSQSPSPVDHPNPSLCPEDQRSNQPQWLYHANARQVPPPPLDPALRREFLGLFHRALNTDHTHGSPFEDTPENAEPSLIDPSIIAEINELCSRSTFFYSFAPRHMRAIMLLQQQFMAQPTPARVLQLAKSELYRHEINSRVWYYALLATVLARPDLSGYYVAWPLDATPDLYFPASVLNLATAGSSRPLPVPTSNQCVRDASERPRPFDVEFFHHQSIETQPSFYEPFAHFLLRNKRSTNATSAGPAEKKKGNKKLKRVPRQIGAFFLPPEALVANTDYVPPPESNVNFLSASPSPPSQPQIPALNRFRSNKERNCYVFNGTNGATSDAENRLWYFREDIETNQHHFFWHQYYPQNSGSRGRVPDRRGELFYFTHHNIIARYNAERLSNGLPRVVSLDLRLNGNIGEGYNSDIIDKQSGNRWTPRPLNTLLSNINHQNDPDFRLNVTLDEISNIYRTLVSHIREGFLLANRSVQAGQPPVVFPLDIRTYEGVTHLGNTLEAAERLSLHPNLYHAFGVHNLGHIAIALSTDPDFNGQCPTGVMADLTVTMRDPAFYRLHSLVDDIFNNYKSTLEPYQLNDGDWPLVWNGVKIRSLKVIPSVSRRNHIKTFWSVRRVPLEEGIDGTIHDGDVEADICQTHLNHEPFMFKLSVDVSNCLQSETNQGTVRIFMAPRYDVNGRRFTMEETRRLMFQLDSFPVQLSRGRNIITRNSQDSASIRPWSRNLLEILRDPDNGGQTEFCGCGWPAHLYIPKGTPQGMEFDLFAMITNFDHDRVQDTRRDLRIPEPCTMPHVLCGIPFRKYPDARPLGYPFDRKPYSVIEDGRVIRPADSLEEFVAHVPNMKSSVITIQHMDRVV